MERLGLNTTKIINDTPLLEKMKSLIFHDGDTRPVWVGGGYAETNTIHKNYAKWANEHWALYYSFIDDIDEFNNKLVLDLGCGSGFCTRNLGELFNNSNIIGMDIDIESISFCKEYNGGDGIEYTTTNVVTEDINSGVDYIFFVETMEHIKHQYHNDLIDKLLSSLNDGGKLFISTPNEQTFVGGDKGHIGILTKPHFHEFKKRYEKNIKSVNYLDNTKLLNGDYITNDDRMSHFKIVLTK
jgi:trans-aconitate methyltransferase